MENELDFSKLVRVIGRGIYADESRGGRTLRAVYAVVGEENVIVTLDDARTVSTPIAWYPRLQHTTPAERNDWELIMKGRAVLWRSLNMAISVKSMLDGEKATEEPENLRKWLNQRKKQTA